MVLLHVKTKNESDQFLVETSVETLVQNVLKQVSLVHISRLKIRSLCASIDELKEYGPTRPESEQGTPYAASPTKPDPLARRVGTPPDASFVAHFEKASSEALAAIDKENVARKSVTSIDTLSTCLETLHGVVMMAYPEGLPADDPVQVELQRKDGDIEGLKDAFPLDAVSLWWAGKSLLPSKALKEYVGRNEKTKVVVTLQHANSGAPARQPVMDTDSQKNMMSYYFRKQEEQKRLDQNEEDDYLHSAWANPNSLRNSFQGVGNISWKPGM